MSSDSVTPSMSDEVLAPVLERIDVQLDASIQRLCDLLRIPSISTDPEYAPQTRQAAEFMSKQLSEMGFDSQVCTTEGHPMVMATADGPEGTPTILYYGHYDVQPPDPVDLWDSPPFEPAIIEGENGPRVVARGAVDDKGQLMTFVEAFRAWYEVHGSYPCTVKIMLEGEEESGSPSLDGFIEQSKDALAADVCIVSDTGMWDIRTPAITTMLRGMIYLDIVLEGPDKDLHSGMYGGTLVNPLNALTSMLGTLWDQEGRVQIPGFYDDVEQLPEEVASQWSQLDFDETAFLQGAGMKTPYGEHGYSTMERMWCRPTCDLNGILGGYTGHGAKTVIGTTAMAKVSCRLVARQDPAKIQASLERMLHDMCPPDCRLTITSHGSNPAISVPIDSPWLSIASGALESVYGRPALLIGTGGSIPAVGSIKDILGIDSLLVGFGLDDDCVHSPNEKFEVRCLHMGIRSHAAILASIAAGGTC